MGFKDYNHVTKFDIMKRHPRIVAHLIAESLGYFTPDSAASALAKAQQNQPFYCEWYCHMAQSYDDVKVREVTKDTLRQAIRRRHTHRGSMASYQRARQVIRETILLGEGPMFASWF